MTPPTKLPFAKWVQRATPRFEETEVLRAIGRVVDRINAGETVRAVIDAPPRHGKAVADDTPMLTRRGWVRANEVEVGDVLVGSNGRWTRVVAVHLQGVVPLFRVTFSDGAAIDTCGEHRWLVAQRYGYRPTVKTTARLAGDLFEDGTRRKWRIPLVAPFVGRSSELPLDPYLLGVWLGDGTTARAEITSMDPEIVEAIGAAGFKTSYVYKRGRASTYGVLKLAPVLTAMGVLNNKHVPYEYLSATADVRLAVLQGLADTDGTVAKNGSQQSICTTLPGVAVDIRWLVHSLGGVCTTSMKYPPGAKPAFNIYFRLPKGVDGFRLRRKLNLLAPHGPRNEPRRFVASIAPIAAGAARCFEVDAPDHLFCAGKELIITHNSEGLLHAPTFLLENDPRFLTGYITYESGLARDMSHIARQIAQEQGIELERNALRLWQNKQRGGLFVTSIGGVLTGKGFRLLIVDDSFKNRAEAESKRKRDTLKSFLTSTVFTRLEPTASILVCGTRWHPDDAQGELIKKGWEHIHLPAINDAGEALWPSRWSVEALNERRAMVGEYDWWSLYQGSPRPRGGSLFGDPTTYQQLPTRGTYGIGIDLSYTKKTTSDYSVAVVMMRCDESGKDGKPVSVHYVLEVVRLQCRAPEFKAQLRALTRRYPTARIKLYGAAIEQGTVDLFAQAELDRNGNRLEGVNVEFQTVKDDKFVRAQPVAAAWNRQLIALPEEARWLDAFVSEVVNFTGVGDDHDDQVDALAAAFDLLEAPIRYRSAPSSPRRM